MNTLTRSPLSSALISTRPSRPRRRSAQVLIPRELELTMQQAARKRQPWLSAQDMRDCAMTFLLAFTGTLIMVA